VGSQYRFVDRWHVGPPLEQAFDVVADTLAYPKWWGKVFVSVEGDGGPPRPGRHVSIVSRGFLPYLLRWEAEVTATDPPHGFDFTMTGDFVGGGSWAFEESADGTNAVFDFRPRVEKALVKNLTPVLRPLFRTNHAWAMRQGQRGVDELFASRRAG
jgi:hypothetical protein